jgi:hypothetical protein
MIKVEALDTTIPTDLDGFAVDPVESFYDALTTKRGSVIGNYKYGTEFHKRKHRALTTATLIDYKRDLRDACGFDPRLSFQRADLDLTQINEGVVMFDVYVGIGRISGRLVA